MQDISLADARRIALAAQGFGAPRPRRADERALRRVIGRMSLLQIDSVNVFARAHYVPPFSRIGPYDAALLDRLAYERRHLFEYNAHMASLLPVELYPLFRWRMERHHPAWAAYARAKEGYIEDIYRQVRDRGPIAAAELTEPGERAGPWWGWSEGKRALEWLFYSGRLAVSGRRNFERLYDLTERVIPAEALGAPAPPPDEARELLLRIAARALGVATEVDLRDYFHMAPGQARPLIGRLVEGGELEPVRVEGWPKPAYLARGARIPERIEGRALLSPFDPLVWTRDRVERLFGFRYRIEIYVPAAKRVHGYYVLPFLHGERLVARVDLKADRAARALLVQAAHLEPRVGDGAVDALASALGDAAAWLALDGVRVGRRGNLAAPLRRSLGGVRSTR